MYIDKHAVVQLAEALRYKPEVRGFILDGAIFHRHNSFSPTMAVISTQLLTEMSNRDFFFK